MISKIMDITQYNLTPYKIFLILKLGNIIIFEVMLKKT